MTVWSYAGDVAATSIDRCLTTWGALLLPLPMHLAKLTQHYVLPTASVSIEIIPLQFPLSIMYGEIEAETC